MSPAEPAFAFETPQPPCSECESLEELGIQVLLCRRCDHNVEIADRFRTRRHLDLVDCCAPTTVG